MNNEKILFETGATSSAVNELILYTDNTRELAEDRDCIYEKIFKRNIKFDRKDAPTDIHNNYYSLFNDLRLKAIREYKRAFPHYEDHKHMNHTKLLSDKPGTWSDNDSDEYCQIYANRFDEWKKERERNDKQK